MTCKSIFEIKVLIYLRLPLLKIEIIINFVEWSVKTAFIALSTDYKYPIIILSVLAPLRYAFNPYSFAS
jgi:hypothetical protein